MNVPTPVEIVANLLEEVDPGSVSDILVPEQCFTVWIDGKGYHIMVEELPT